MKVLITGATGQVGSDLTKLLINKKGIEVYPFSRQALDVTDQDLVKNVMNEIKPDIAIHCAANTNVDDCEINPDSAFVVNAYGTRNIAVQAERHKAKMIYISTDYVFDGQENKPYSEFHPTRPVSVYGASKLAGEDFVKSFCSRYFIVRTSWVYGWVGKNFVKSILKLTGEKNELTVVDDQVGSPTFSYDLAVFLTKLINSEAYGTFHATNCGHCSWYEFSKEILKVFDIKNVIVKPIKTVDLKRPAPRPHYSVLSNHSLLLNGFLLLPEWQEALQRFRSGHVWRG